MLPPATGSDGVAETSEVPSDSAFRVRPPPVTVTELVPVERMAPTVSAFTMLSASDTAIDLFGSESLAIAASEPLAPDTAVTTASWLLFVK